VGERICSEEPTPERRTESGVDGMVRPVLGPSSAGRVFMGGVRDHVVPGKWTDRLRIQASRPGRPRPQSLDGGTTIMLSGPAPDIASCRKIQAS
jgi:hypothetical protein